MRSNVKVTPAPIFTHEGAKAQRLSPIKELERTVGTCMLFENTFYEKGSEIADRIAALCKTVKPTDLAALAIRAREELKLRHVPLFLAIQYMSNYKGNPAFGIAARELVTKIIKRPDEMGEMIAMYWKQGKKPLPAQMKKALAACFHNFNAFQFAKWDSANDAIRLRDVMFLVHPKPENEVETALFKMIAEQTLPIPKTWETELSAGKDKKAVWTDLLNKDELAVMAFLMNLRNMDNAGVDHALISSAFSRVNKKWALPYRYITASNHAPWFAEELNEGLLESIANIEKMEGRTFIVVDTSGSMVTPLAGKSEVSRIDAAASLAAIIRGVCQKSRVFWYNDKWAEIPSDATGLSLVRALRNTPNGWTFLKRSLEEILQKNGTPDRIIVVTDEQSADGNIVLPNGMRGYIMNVAAYQYGVQQTGGWIGINGFSERVIDWIRFEEKLQNEINS